MEHKPSVSTIGWDMNLLAAAYDGIISSGITYYVQGIVMQKKGPVFVTTFSPLIHHGVIGAILIVMGLYSILWGKHKENKEKETEITIEVLKCCSENRMTLETVVEDAETNNDIEMQKGEASRKLRVAIGVQKV
ncbi:WAT1-related protein [Glycine soja]